MTSLPAKTNDGTAPALLVPDALAPLLDLDAPEATAALSYRPASATPRLALPSPDAPAATEMAAATASSADAPLPPLTVPIAEGAVPALVETAAPSGAVESPAPAATPAADGAQGAADSNDTYYNSGALWGMFGDTSTPSGVFGSQAAEAWAAGHTGSTTTIIGVIDTGIDYTHPDIYLNIWLNQGEIPAAMRAQLRDIDGDTLITFRDLNNALNAALVSDINGTGYIDAGDLLADTRWANGVDDEGDGFRDDLVGWDFVNNDNNPFDDNGHGSHVAGTIGATGGNGIGVVGVNWSVQMVAIKTLNASNAGTNANAASGIDYFTTLSQKAAAAENYVATNNSWTASGTITAITAAVGRAAQADILFVAAAGNSGSNNNTTPSYPSGINTTATAGYDAVIAVASIDINGNLAATSDYGSTTVDLGAPGVSILSLLPVNQATGGGVPYQTLSGTSMATPHVTGALALLASENPNATAAQLKAALLATTNATASLTNKTVTGGRLDVSNLLNSATATPAAGATGNDSIIGGTADNVLTGNGGNDSLDGRDGGDTLIGGDANDTLIGGNGADRLDGGVGIDLVSYAGATAGVSVDLVAGTAAEGDTLIGIERLTGSGFADTLLGSAVDERLLGGAGADTILADAGNDTVAGGAGADTLDGGAGLDLLDFSAATAGVAASIGSGIGSGGEAAGDLYSGFELVLGSAFGDTITGGLGAETITGGAGNDRLAGGLGDDRLDGGSGSDTVAFASTSGETTLLGNFDGSVSASGPEGNDLLVGIETAVFSDGAVVVPGAPTLSIALTSDTGVSGGDRISQSAALSGLGRPLTAVTLTGSVAGTTATDASGRWSFTPVSPLDGAYTVVVSQVDGVSAVRSASLGFTIDTAAPVAPTLDLIAASDSGVSNSDKLTNDTTPDLAGTTEAGSTVAIFRDGVAVGNATVTGTNWSFASAALGNGSYSFTARSTDVAGNVSAASAPVVVTVDATAPVAPGITLIAASDSGLSNSDRITSDTTPDLSGTTEAGSTVTVFRTGVAVGNATVTGTSWSFSSAALADGSYSFTARATDAAGNVSAASAALVVTIDTAAPVAPGITLIAASDTGASSSDRISNDTTPDLAGTTEAGSTVAIFRDGVAVGNATVTGTNWSFASAALGNGTYAFTARTTDAAGNVSALSSALSVTIDTTAPGVPTAALIAASDSGVSNSDRLTNDTTPDLAGTTEAGSTVAIFRDGVAVGNATVTGTNWSFASAALGNGSYSFTARSTDVAGNVSAASAPVVVTVDATAPVAPGITLIAASDSGLSNSDRITSDTTPDLNGTTEAGSTVTVFRAGVAVGNATVTGTSWSFSSAALADGSYSFTARATDAAGNVSAASAALVVTVDTAAPGAASITSATALATDGSLISLAGLAEANGSVVLRDGGTSIGTAAVDALGRWSVATSAALASGLHQLSALAFDTAGNAAATASPALSVQVAAAPAGNGLVAAASGGATLAGAPALTGFDGADYLTGTTGADTLAGAAGRDVLDAQGGNDSLAGGDGDDVLVAGDGADTVTGDAGSDLLYGGGDNDSLAGGAGQDQLSGDAGADSLSGGDDGDVLVGGEGNDVLAGDAGDDLLYGGPGNDSLAGGEGNDQLSGEGGDNTLSGGNGADVLVGGDGNDLISGDAGADILYGGTGNDTLLGGDGNDQLSGEGGNNSLDGGAGNDVLVGGDGPATLSGGLDDDYLSTGADNDILLGGAGNDMLIAGNGANSLDGGAGNDVLAGGIGADTMQGGDGADYFIAGDGNDSLSGGIGDDQMFGDGGDDSLSGGSGNDLVLGGDGNNALSGDDGNDYIVGGTGRDTVLGGLGDDQVFGGGADNSLAGGAGNDLLIGGDGNDTLTGDDGQDYIVGGAGQDSLAGGAGNDELFGGEGANTLDGGDGDDGLNGGTGAESILGGVGADYIQAGAGNDSVDGGDGNDVLFGEAGADSLRGGAGDDVIQGGDGADTIQGGDGADFMAGGAGADVFLWLRPETGGDFIADFVPGQDLLMISAAGFGGGLAAGDDLALTGAFVLDAADRPFGQFIYDAAAGALYWDADGKRPGAAQLLVVLADGPALSASDIHIIA